jgi:hypothetical protein
MLKMTYLRWVFRKYRSKTVTALHQTKTIQGVGWKLPGNNIAIALHVKANVGPFHDKLNHTSNTLTTVHSTYWCALLCHDQVNVYNSVHSVQFLSFNKISTRYITFQLNLIKDGVQAFDKINVCTVDKSIFKRVRNTLHNTFITVELIKSSTTKGDSLRH